MATDRSSRRCLKTAKSGNIQPSHFNFTVPHQVFTLAWPTSAIKIGDVGAMAYSGEQPP